MSLLGSPTEARRRSVARGHARCSMEEIPELNEFQCGTYMMHSLDDAKRIVQGIIDQDIGVNKMRTSPLALSD
ncbi:hypothetical protein HORIV_12500 [Vreelandella olivaria]|uniref:S-ribosylhomocysteine lyase n=1 Tax=Vreelandella olivaria TaxID=390919 RepID=A0ABM7GEP0_9GAMM|nr:hypothetical protein HORIV_12500 [Halomonas olivaria]